VSRINSKF